MKTTPLVGTPLVTSAENHEAENVLCPASKNALLPVAARVLLLGESLFQPVLRNPPAGVFDTKSWVCWHNRFHMDVPPLPARRLP